MVERHVYIKLAEPFSNAASRAEVAAHTLSVFPTFPGVTGVTVGQPADAKAEAAWDLCIIVRFNALEDVDVYYVDPGHRAYVDDYLKPKLAVLKAWNFNVAHA